MKKKETTKKTVKPGAKKQTKRIVKKATAKIKKKPTKKTEKAELKTKAKKEVKKPAKITSKKPVAKKSVKKTKEKAKKTTRKQKITKTSEIAALREKEPKKIAMPKRKITKPARTIKPAEERYKVPIVKQTLPEKIYQPTELEKGLPAEYGKNRITLMTVDPWKLFAYWEVGGDTLAGLKGRLVLRVYDVTGIYFDGRNANIVFDIPVHERVGDGYIGAGPGRNFIVAIGIVSPEGDFTAIATSNTVATPAVRVSKEEGLLSQEIEPVGYL